MMELEKETSSLDPDIQAKDKIYNDKTSQKTDFKSSFSDKQDDLDFHPLESSQNEKIILLSEEVMSQKKILRQDFSNLVLLNVLYLYSGFLLGFFTEFIRNYLIQEKNISGKDIATLEGSKWPFSIKFIWAPIMDTYYVKCFGRRKTYIVPTQFLISVALFFTAFELNGWMQNEEIWKISVICTACFILITIQVIAVDSWSITLLHPKNMAYASFSKFFGQKIGSILGYQIFIFLSDQNLMKTLFGYDGQVLTPFSMCMIMSAMFFIGTMYLILFRKETENVESILHHHDKHNQNKMEHTELTCKEMSRNIIRFFQNKRILMLIGFLLSVQFGHFCLNIPADIILLKKGFSRSTLATIKLAIIPIVQVISMFSTKLSAKQQEFRIWLWSLIGLFVVSIANYYLIDAYDGNTYNFIVLIALVQCLTTIFLAIPFVSIGAFFFRMCDPSISGTYLTFLNSFANLGNLWPEVLISSLFAYISFSTLFIISLISNILIFIIWRKRAIEMQQSPKVQWLIKQN